MVEPVAHWLWVIGAAIAGFVAGAIVAASAAQRVAHEDNAALQQTTEKQRQHIRLQADYIRAVEIDLERYRNAPKILQVLPDEHAVVRGTHAFPWQERGSQN